MGWNQTKRSQNLTPLGRKALNKLAKDPNLVIKSADKGSGIVIEDREKYIKDGEEHLADETIYQSDPTPQLSRAINKDCTTREL